MSLSKKQLDGIKNVFQEYNVCFAYLYGSRANGSANLKSDYDFAVYLPDKINFNKRYKSRLEMINRLGGIIGSIEKVDLVIVNDVKSALLRFTIIKEGKLIYEKEHDKRLLFELNSMNSYYDFLPFINLYNQAFAERVLRE